MTARDRTRVHLEVLADALSLPSEGARSIYNLYIPELGFKPFRSILNCPERLYAAWHRDCTSICELLDERGHMHGHPPQDRYWDVREYVRTVHYPDTEAFYERGAA